MIEQERLADLGAAGAAVGWFTSVAVETLPIIQWLAGVAAIIAALCAAYYHIKKAGRA